MAARLVECLCEVDLFKWRSAARIANRAASRSSVDQVLSAAASGDSSASLWRILDALETANHRLTGPDAGGVIRGVAERRSVESASRRAVLAILFSELLRADDVKEITAPFLALILPA